MKKHLNVNTVLLMLLGALGGFVKYDVDKIRIATDQVPIVLERMIALEKRVETLEKYQMLQDERLRVIEDKRAKP